MQRAPYLWLLLNHDRLSPQSVSQNKPVFLKLLSVRYFVTGMRKVTNNGNALGSRQELQEPLGIYPLSTVIVARLLSPATSVQVCSSPTPASVSAAPDLHLLTGHPSSHIVTWSLTRSLLKSIFFSHFKLVIIYCVCVCLCVLYG